MGSRATPGDHVTAACGSFGALSSHTTEKAASGKPLVRPFRATDRPTLEPLWAGVFPTDRPRNAPAIMSRHG
jgi:hypothetical protein